MSLKHGFRLALLMCAVGLWPATEAGAQCVVYVDGSAAGPVHDGTSWCSAFLHLQDALGFVGDAAEPGREIRVADGVYRPDEGASQTPGDSSAWFALPPGVPVRGGYAGCGAPSEDERDVDAHRTILSGDLNGDDVADFLGFMSCYSGWNDPYPSGCEAFDLDGDGDVDEVDGGVSENASHVVFASGAPDALVLIEGFTVESGYNWFGPGAGLHASGPAEIRDCTFRWNSTSQGGAVACSDDVTISGCLFTENVAGEGGAVAVFGHNDEVLIEGTVFDRNRTMWAPQGGGQGGAVYSMESVTIRDCLFVSNAAPGGEGGAIYGTHYSSLVVVGCAFIENSAGSAGAVYSAAEGTLMNSAFHGNEATSGMGGGLLAKRDAFVVSQCVFTGNSAPVGGGVAALGDSAMALTNCTIAYNQGVTYGGGVYVESATPTIVNTILWGNTYDGPSAERAQIFFWDAVPDITYSTIQGIGVPVGGVGNTLDDPLFVDPAGVDGILGTADDDLHLSTGSAAIDAGNNDGVPLCAVDHDYLSRFVDDPREDTGAGAAPIVDMGAFEAGAARADCDRNGLDDVCEGLGAQPDCNANGVPDACDILDGSSPDCDGDGVPDECGADCNGNGVADGCDIRDGASRDVDADGVPDECQPARFHVDSSASGRNDGTTWEHAYSDLQVALEAARGAACRSVEVWVAAGTYRPDAPDGDRMASFELHGSLRLYGGFAGWESNPDQRDLGRHVTILSGDLNGNDGAGGKSDNSCSVVRRDEIGAAAVLDGFTITGGYGESCDVPSGHLGGGLENRGGSLAVRSCVFVSNSAGGGGGIGSEYGDMVVTHCSFLGNQASIGSAIRNGYGNLVLRGCLFSGNQAAMTGTVEQSGGELTMVECSMALNYSAAFYSGLEAHGAMASIHNSIFWGNRAQFSGGAQEDQIWMSNIDAGTTFDHNCVEFLTDPLGGVGNIGDDPMFVDADGADGIAGSLDDDLRLLPGSPAINAGDPAFDDDLIPIDLDGHARVLCGRVDMGAYEFGIGDVNCDEAVDLADVADLHGCMTGPGGGPPLLGCEAFDFDYDGDIDLFDLRGFQVGFDGAE